MNNKISVVTTEDKPIEKNEIVTVYFGEKYMLISHKKNGDDVGYKKLSSNLYINSASGAIKTIDKSANIIRSIDSLRKSFFKLSVLISLNYSGHQSEAFISLTYDRKKIKADCIGRDLKNFWAKFNRFNKSQKLYRCLFLCEYQGNGHPHIHVLLKRLDNEKIALSKSELFSLWGNGYCDIQPIYDIDGLIEYLNPFHNTKKKKRLGYYQPYERIFRCRGRFNRPKKFKMSYESALKLAEENNLVQYENDSFEVLDRNKETINIIKKIKFKGDI